LKKWMMILGVFVILLGAGLSVGCSNKEETKEPEVSTMLLTVTEPQDETTVYAAALVVKGQTEADAVVSVDGVTIEVGADGKFSTTVTLEEGPNLIQVDASDFEGNEGSIVLTVIYDKQ
jgi:cytochrome oxidase Cu insertion factor (SCO1/SenC/PrrC family)